MSPVRIFVGITFCAVLASPFASAAGPSGDVSARCIAVPMTLVERRITEQAAGGPASLIAFVNRTKPIYQLDLVETVAWLDTERARRDECTLASARAAAAR